MSFSFLLCIQEGFVVREVTDVVGRLRFNRSRKIAEGHCRGGTDMFTHVPYIRSQVQYIGGVLARDCQNIFDSRMW